jgi:hypothetical protein
VTLHVLNGVRLLSFREHICVSYKSALPSEGAMIVPQIDFTRKWCEIYSTRCSAWCFGTLRGMMQEGSLYRLTEKIVKNRFLDSTALHSSLNIPDTREIPVSHGHDARPWYANPATWFPNSFMDVEIVCGLRSCRKPLRIKDSFSPLVGHYAADVDGVSYVEPMCFCNVSCYFVFACKSLLTKKTTRH